MNPDRDRSRDSAECNLSQAIRDCVKRNPDATPEQISKLLAASGVKVAPGYIAAILAAIRTG